MENEEASQKACEEFEAEIEGQEDFVFGFTLFHQTAPGPMRWLQARAYRQTVQRLEIAIRRARQLLADVKTDKATPEQLAGFNWPPWTSDMEERIMIMLRAYSITFPFRPKEPLNAQELSALKRTAMELI